MSSFQVTSRLRHRPHDHTSRWACSASDTLCGAKQGSGAGARPRWAMEWAYLIPQPSWNGKLEPLGSHGWDVHLLIDFFEKSKLYCLLVTSWRAWPLPTPPSHHLKIHRLSPATHAIFHALPRLLVWRPQARKTPQAPQERQRQEGRPWQVEAPRGLGGTVEVTLWI
jgi:hypothetical protein